MLKVPWNFIFSLRVVVWPTYRLVFPIFKFLSEPDFNVRCKFCISKELLDFEVQVR